MSMALGTLRPGGGTLNMRDLARQVGLSQRRFIEVFAREVGLTPKRFSRVLRFQRARAMAATTSDPDRTGPRSRWHADTSTSRT